MNSKPKEKLSLTSKVHITKLVYRSILFIAAVLVYIFSRINLNSGNILNFTEGLNFIIIIIFVSYLIEMIIRLFPNKFESMGCNKMFARYYKQSENPVYKPKRTGFTLVVVSWVLLNACFAVLYFLNIFDQGIMVLISLIYGISDMICILFFCPFQTWMMHNKCCNTCRIYNWDFLMICTPLIFLNTIATWILVGVSVLIFIRWEVTYMLHKERFYESSNLSIQCQNCKEHLCHHKKQLQSLLKNKKFFNPFTKFKK